MQAAWYETIGSAEEVLQVGGIEAIGLLFSLFEGNSPYVQFRRT